MRLPFPKAAKLIICDKYNATHLKDLMHQAHFLPIACCQPKVGIKFVLQVWDVRAVIGISREVVYYLRAVSYTL